MTPPIDFYFDLFSDGSVLLKPPRLQKDGSSPFCTDIIVETKVAGQVCKQVEIVCGALIVLYQSPVLCPAFANEVPEQPNGRAVISTPPHRLYCVLVDRWPDCFKASMICPR